MSYYPPISREAAALSVLLDRHGRRHVRKLCSLAGGAYPALSSGGERFAESAVRTRQELCARSELGLVCQSDTGFPELLRCIPDAPLLLYFRGSLEVLEGVAIAIVGARRASRYGLELARSLAEDLAGCGATVSSGLALGIDGAAHRGALAAGGRTVAVFGSGLDRVAPVSHRQLAEQIRLSGGLLLAEYPPDKTAVPHQFPERNRLISGISAGVLVIEASARSGSLITARLAAEQGREVMAVPGAPGLPNSAGANRLLKAGAALVESAQDVLDALALHLPEASIDARPRIGMPPLTSDLADLLDHLDGQPSTVDSLAAVAGLSVQECSMRLTELELGGFVQRVADGYIRRPSGF